MARNNLNSNSLDLQKIQESLLGVTRGIPQDSNSEALKFILDVSKKLSSSLDYQKTLDSIAKLTVPFLADWSAVQVYDETGENLIRLRTAFADPAKEKLAHEFEQKYHSLPRQKHSQNFLEVLETGKSKLVPNVTDSWYKQATKDETRRTLLKQMNPTSHLIVPLKVHSRKIIGVLSLARLDNSRRYDKTDLILAEGLAQRAAVALDNAKLYQSAKQEIERRKKTEIKLKQIQNNLSYLAQASKILASSLDYQITLSNIAKASVPKIADFCTVDLLDDKNNLKQVTIAYKKEIKKRWENQLQEANLEQESSTSRLLNVIRTGRSEVYQTLGDKILAKLAKNNSQLKLAKKIGFKSAMIVPLRMGLKNIGRIVFILTGSDRQYTEDDLAMAEELASRASLSLENASLYRDSQQAVSLRDDFISVASHELKTPLTSAKIFTQILKQRFTKLGDDKSVEHLTKMNRLMDKLTELIYDMLDVSKIQAGRLEIKQKVFNFDDLIKEIVEILQHGDKKHNLIINGKISKKIYGDADRVGQVVSNLVSNAIKYSPASDKVIIHLSSDNKNAYVCVEDFGIGIAKEHTDHVFERFYRVFDETDKTFPGLGIGLYISNEIIKSHHGKLWVESNIGKGSKFFLSLPLKK